MAAGTIEAIDNFVAQLATATGTGSGGLLQALCEIQYRYSCIPPQAIEQLAAELGLPVARILGVIEFYSFLHTTPRGDFDILLSDSITDHMLGSRQLLQWLCNGLGVEPGEPRNDGRVTVGVTSCTGICDQGPALLVNGWTVARLDEARIDAIVKLVETGVAVDDWPADFFQVDDNIQRRDLLLTERVADTDALHALLQRGGDALLAELDRSGLRGRGGAGFNTAAKWRFCREAQAAERYVVCNADEGEPGTFKDRVLLNSYADRVFEGMTLCAGIIGARHGYLYLRGEYRYLRAPLEAVLERRRQDGLLGRNIRGEAGLDFDIEIHMGAGAYICGEESALIESLEGKRGIPRKRPPFPVTRGFRDQPTVVNNVETFMAAADIAVHGADWFRASGTPESTGTKLLSISGDCARPGIYEYPFGTTIRQVLQDCGADDVQAVQVAGAAGATVPPEEFDRTLAFEDYSTGGSFMIFSNARDLLAMVQNFAHFFVHESCGFCTPCRVGGSLLKDLVDKVCAGHAGEYDLQEMHVIAGLMRHTSHCGLGTTAPNPVLDTLQKFPKLYQARLGPDGYEPAFDLDAALSDARELTGRDDSGAHLKPES
jgi:[NiFe] hydrogenase diaphorase moiety large subunit